jgi:hypothetical protein
MIKCPYCGKELNLQAVLASEMPSQLQPKKKWYFATFWIVFIFLSLGPLAPFALPLVWFNPRYKPMTKWIVTVLVVAISAWVAVPTWNLLKSEYSAYQNMMQQLNKLGTGKF